MSATPQVPDLGKRVLGILQHTLGLDEYGNSRDPGRPNGYRNHFVASKGHHDWEFLMLSIQHGLMEQHEAMVLSGGSPWFNVTSVGRAYVTQYSPKPPKLTRGQQRYQRFLRLSDVYDMSFKEFVQGRWYLPEDKRREWEDKQLKKRVDALLEEDRRRKEVFAGVREELNKWKEQYGNPSAKTLGAAGSGTEAAGAGSSGQESGQESQTT